MQLKLDQHSPIYMQIIDEFKRQIARGELRPGDRIPSQRELAMMIQVNPNTVQRAYREMELMGITETLRGQGTFITRDPARVAEIRREMAGRALVGFVREMHALGYDCEEMVSMVRGTYREVIGDAAPRGFSERAAGKVEVPAQGLGDGTPGTKVQPNREGGEPHGHGGL